MIKLSVLCCLLLLLFAVSVKAQTFTCYSDGNCGSDGGEITGTGSNQVACCQHGVAPFGLSYTIEGVEGCLVCPIDFGFVNPTFTAQESTDTYPVELAFFSGQSALGGFFLNLQLQVGTASTEDIGFTFNRVFFPDLTPSEDLDIRTADILFRLDSTTQESNETFTLTFPPDADFLPGANLRNSFQGVIVDATRVTFELSEEDYREREGDTGFMPVVIAKDSQVFLANPVTFLVIPWTVQQAIDEGLIPRLIDVPNGTNFSPNRADAEDFNITRIITDFPADEGNPMTDLDVPIRVINDDKNEANDQYFIAEFRVVAAPNMSLIGLEQRASRCRIVDNDPLRIGFQLSQYDYLEPEEGSAVFSNVTLVKENNVESEQTFGVQITFGDPGGDTNAAILQPENQQGVFDYVVGRSGDNTLLTLFQPQDSEVTFSFTVFADDLVEGTEGFRATLSPEGDIFPNFALPEDPDTSPFQDTLIRILDSDFAFVGFERPSYTVNENSRSAEVCVILRNPPVVFDIILEVTPTEVTADSSDFLNRAGAAFFQRNTLDNRTCTRFAIRQDDLYENTEFFNVTLSLQGGATGVIIDPPVTQVFILDDTQLTIGFIDPPYQANETDDFATVEFGILEGSIVPSVSVPVALSFSDDSALGGSDYQVTLPQTFVFDSDRSSYTAMVPIINDDIFELTEVFQASLGFPAGVTVERVIIDPFAADISIVDDDNIVFGFDPDTYSDSEDVATQTLTVRQISGNAGEFLFILSAATDDSSAAATAVAGSDYVSNSGALAPISIGQSSTEFSVNIINDDLTERSEIFEAILTGVTVLTGAGTQASLSAQERGRIQFSPDRAQVEIVDADDAIIGFFPVEYTSLESEGPINFNFSVIQGNITFDLSVLFTASDGSAISGGDYEATSVEYTITGMGSVIAPVILVDDSVGEESENFFGNLAFGGGETFSNIMFAPNQAEATIIDDDDVTFGFDPAIYSIDESEQRVVFNVTLVSGVLVRNVEIEFFTEDGSAIAGADYTGVSRVLTFGPGVSFVEVVVDVADDGLWEINESFIGNLRLPEGGEDMGNILFQPDRAVATILDEDSIRIGYVQDYTVTEGVDASVAAEIRVLEGELGRNVVIRAFTENGSAIAGMGNDYIANSELITFSPGNPSFSLLVGIEDDDVVEGEEFFLARATVETVGAQRLTVQPEQSTITIQDPDMVTIGFNQNSYDIVENERVVNVTIVLNGFTDRPITVVLNTNDGTAISSGSERDFVPVMDLAITFPPSDSSMQTMVVQITVIDDMFVERDEMLQSVISLSAGDDSQVILSPAEASITIRNDDMVVIGFEETLYTVAEDIASGFALVRVRILMGTLRVPVQVTFFTEDGTAIAGSDYQAVAPTVLTFDRDQDSFDFMIPIINDDIHELTETFRGRLITTEASSILTLNPESATIQINDNEMVSFSFRSPSHLFIENMGSATVYIDKQGDTDQTFMLMLLGPLQNGGRIDRNITFGPSDTEIAINFTIIDDPIALEPTESFDWTLALITMIDRASVQPFDRTTIEIMDNDELELSLSKNGEVNESDTAQACIGFSTEFATDFMINTAAGAPVNVSSIIEGIATSGEDFTPPQSPLMATAGTYDSNNPLCFDIPINDDMFVEVEECFMVSISLPSSAADLAVSITDGEESSLCCIEDNDRVRIGFEEILYEVDENDPSGRVNVAVIVFGDNLRRAVEVIFSTRDGSATSTAPRDYESLTAPVQFDEQQRRQVLSINIDDDDILEDTENFFGQLTASVSDNFVDLDPAQTEINIFDIGDEVTIGFRPDSYTVNETDGSVTLNVEVLDGMLERSVTVLFFTESGTATQEAPADFSGISRVLTFNPDMLSQGVPVTIINDDIVEDTETFFGNLDSQGQPVTTSPEQATVMIFEDPADRVTIGFERTSYPTNEGTLVEVCALILDGEVERDVAVRVSSVAGTASAGAGDYESVDEPLIFTPTANRRCFNVTVNDDDILEIEERFTLELDSDDPMVVLNPDEAEVIITDTDGIVVALEQTEFTATEADGAFIEVCAIITSTTTLDRDAVVTLQSADGTATSSGESDFVALNSDLTFSAGIRRICRIISIINDAFYEDPENFEVSLSTTDPSVSIDPSRQTGEATIVDDDAITIGFVRETDSVAENTPGSIDVCVVVLSGMLERSAVVTVETADAGQGFGFAAAGNDYTASSRDITFTNANRDVPQCLNVPITDDVIVEGSELFFGLLSNTDNVPRLILDPQRTSITIADNEVVSIGFINTPYRQREDNGPAVITVEARGDLQKDIEVMVTTEETGSAIADTDYSTVSTVITFNQTVNVIDVEIPLIDDQLVEGDETLNARITILTVGNIQFFTPETEPVTILDNDRVIIGVDETMVSVNESVGVRELCASIISGMITRDVVVNVVYEDRNARDGEDYNSDPRMLTFSPGVSRVCFNISIIDDTRYELDEDFFVNITTTDPQVDINPMTTLVSIVDDEILTIGWEFPEYNVAEADGEVEICAVVRSGTTQAITLPRINILPIGDSATAPDDYDDRPDPRFFDFQPGSPTRMCTRVTIAMDGILEPTESFFADLADLPTQRVVYDPQRTRIIVSDSDDATIGFRPDTYTVNEGDGFVDIVVEVLDGTLATDVVVRLTTSDGSATSVAPADYGNPGEVLLTFSSSVTSITTTVTIEDDQIAENPEEFFGNLERVTDIDRVTVAPNAASITINDNDVPIIGFEMTVYDAVENNSVTTEVCVVVMMPPALDRMVSVVVTTSDGTAQAPVDYTSLMMTLVFSPGNGRQCVQIDAREDEETEGEESFTVTLTSTDNVDLSPPEATINIMDDNEVRIRFGRPSYFFNESDGTGTIEVVKVGVSTDLIRVRVSGGPSNQTDVVVSADGINNTIIEFPAGGSNVVSIPITFNINDDEIGLEAVEMYIASLEIISSVGDVRPGEPEMTLINILDDDIVNVSFGQPMVQVEEDDGEFMMCVTKDRITLVDVIVTITSSPGTATPGSDYTPENIPSSVTIPAGSLMMCFVSPSIEDDDDGFESNETFTLEIPSTDPMDPRIVIDDPTTTVVIEDSDVVTIRFEQPTYTVREDAGVVEICVIKEPRTPTTVFGINVLTRDGSATSGEDYIPVIPNIIFDRSFGARECYDLPIVDNDVFEPTEHLDLRFRITRQGIFSVDPQTARVFIEDDDGRVIEVNDTVIGDPLFTVPILVPEEQLAALNLTRLTMCYEIHGGSDQWFNLVTDECTSVNARYDDLNEDLNIIDEIGVRTVDTAGRCLNIGVNVEQCAAQINGVAMDRYSRDGVSVRRYGNRRVRISVPNCNDYMLVMWVICEQRTLDDPFQPGVSITAEMIKFVVMRGLNTGHRPAHGLLGQFWNVPVGVTPYTGQLRSGEQSQGRFVLNLTTPGSEPRSFTGWLYDLTWEFEEGPCLYVGNRQAGPIYEVRNPNDEVIASLYSDYRVQSAFSEENYDFGMFDESRCVLGSGDGGNGVEPPA